MVVSDGQNCSKMPATIKKDEDEVSDEALPADVITNSDRANCCSNDS